MKKLVLALIGIGVVGASAICLNKKKVTISKKEFIEELPSINSNLLTKK